MCSKEIISADGSRSDRQDVTAVIDEIIARLSEKELRTALMAMVREAPDLFISCLSDPQTFHDVLAYQTTGLLSSMARSLKIYGSLGSGFSVHKKGS